MASLQSDNHFFSMDKTNGSNNITPLHTDKGHQHVVIIDDQKTGRAIVEALIKKISSKIRCYSFSDPNDALEACEKHPPDLLITDYRMPSMNGISVIKKFRQLNGCKNIPVVMVTIVQDRDVMYTALETGATDFLIRPFDHYECQARCKNLLDLYKYQKASLKRAKLLECRVTQATEDIKSREADALICLARAGEFRDDNTGRHIFRMARYSMKIASELGLDNDHCNHIRSAAPMHDIGKIGIPDNILLKPGSLSPSEREIMEKHTTIGHDILEGSKSPYLNLGAKIALSHHEWFDGSGYPHGLKGQEIPIEARIVAVADVLDALTSSRPYKSNWSMEDSLEHIKKTAGSHFDPDCVKALLSIEESIHNIYNELHDVPT